MGTAHYRQRMKLLPFILAAAAAECPNSACWSETGGVCTLKSDLSCSKITCGATHMSVYLSSGIFDADLDQALIGDNIKPDTAAIADSTVSGYSWQSVCALGTCNHASDIIGTELVINQVFTFTGTSRRARTEVEANKITIATGLEITTGPVGMSLTFTCKYPVSVTLTSTQFEVEDAPAIVGTKEETGDLASGFSFLLSNAGNAVALGDRITGDITWAVTGLWGTIKFVIQECDIWHQGDTSNTGGTAFKVAIIKDRCYADKLFVKQETTSSSSAQRKFSYQTFLINALDVGTQEIECKIMMCSGTDCNQQTCPDNTGYQYSEVGTDGN